MNSRFLQMFAAVAALTVTALGLTKPAYSQADSQSTYQAFCTLSGDQAVGSVRYTDGFNYFGEVHFKFYDSNFFVIGSYDTDTSGLNGGSGVAHVATYTIPSVLVDRVKSCSFDVSDAVENN